MRTQSIGLSWCSKNQREEATPSLVVKTTAIGLGIIALLSGVLILSLPTFGETLGWGLLTTGVVTLLLGIYNLKNWNFGCAQPPPDFAKITPLNYKEYLDVRQKFEREKGDFIFTEKVHEDTCKPDQHFYEWKTGDTFLDGEIVYEKNGVYYGGELEIQEGKFVHYPQWSKPPEYFSNLKDFFDYLFRGNFYQGEYTKQMEFFSLRTVKGQKITH